MCVGYMIKQQLFMGRGHDSCVPQLRTCLWWWLIACCGGRH